MIRSTKEVLRNVVVAFAVTGALAIGASQALAAERAAPMTRQFCVQQDCIQYCKDTFGPEAIGDCVVDECVCEY